MVQVDIPLWSFLVRVGELVCSSSQVSPIDLRPRSCTYLRAELSMSDQAFVDLTEPSPNFEGGVHPAVNKEIGPPAFAGGPYLPGAQKLRFYSTSPMLGSDTAAPA
jgi:hypothetical protein